MSAQPFDAAAVRALADILVDTGLTEIEVEHKDGRIRVAKSHAPSASVQAVAPNAATQTAPVAATAAAAAVPEDGTHPGAVASPMVGVAYLSSEPGAPPYIAVGQSVVAGQTVLLIEAMKTYNQIKAPKSGVVTRILIASGQPVEFGQPLLILE